MGLVSGGCLRADLLSCLSCGYPGTVPGSGSRSMRSGAIARRRFSAGCNVARTRIAAYALGGLFVALAGIALLAETSQGDPNSASSFTLNSVACVVLGGVSLMGGRGGMLGPIAAAFVLNIIRSILGFLRVDPNYATVIQGAIVVLVVLFAGVLALRRRK